MNEKTNKAGATSGQNVPKSSNGAPTKSDDFVGRGGATERADFGGSAAEGAKAKFATTKFRQKSKQEQAAASKLRMEERGEKLERAKDKLAKQKPPKKPGPVRRIGRAAGGAFWAAPVCSSAGTLTCGHFVQKCRCPQPRHRLGSRPQRPRQDRRRSPRSRGAPWAPVWAYSVFASFFKSSGRVVSRL